MQYGTDAYGECAYQTGCTTGSETGAPGAPDTGFLSKPEIMFPAILGLAIVIAAVILLTKKLVRAIKR